jgi:hypothetical protein
LEFKISLKIIFLFLFHINSTKVRKEKIKIFAKNTKRKKIFVFLTKLNIVNTLDEKFFLKLYDNCKKNISFTEEIASVLDINYDAAYRRIKHKAKLSFSEAIKLAKHFNVSIDSIINQDLPTEKLIVTKSTEINSVDDIELYFKSIINNISHIKYQEDLQIIYNAKDLPLFYFTRNELLSKFLIYIIQYLLIKGFPQKKITVEQNIIPTSVLRAAKKFGDLYHKFNITEIWNNNVLESTLNQIVYFYEIKLLNYSTAIKLCNELTNVLKEIEEESYIGKRKNKENSFLEIYNNELIPLNNNVILTMKNKKIMITPYFYIKYLIIDDQKFINEYQSNSEEQLKLATLLSKAGVKERMVFFKPKYKSIEKTKQRIELLRQFPI